MGTVLLVLVVVLVIAGLVYGVVTLLAGEDPGLSPADPDGRARPLPNTRSLTEYDLKAVRFDVGIRGYRMSQVDRVLRRTAYDIGYKDEMIAVLEAEVIALREGRVEDAELLRKAREAAAAPPPPVPVAGRTPGAHRAEPADGAADVISDDDGEVADAELDDAELDDAADDDDQDSAAPDPDDPTAPGLLNRAAMRHVDLTASTETSGTAEAGADAGSSDESEADASPSEAGGSEPDGSVSETAGSEADDASGPRGSEVDPATEVERRART